MTYHIYTSLKSLPRTPGGDRKFLDIAEAAVDLSGYETRKLIEREMEHRPNIYEDLTRVLHRHDPFRD